MRIIKKLLLIFLLFISILTISVNFLYCDFALRYIGQTIANKKNLQFDVEQISGNLLKGEIKLNNLHLKSTANNTTKFELNIDDLTITAPFTALISSHHIQQITIDGFTGTIAQPIDVKKKHLTTNLDASSKTTAATLFTVQNTKITNLSLTYNLNNQPPSFVNIDSFQNNSFRSNYAIFDLLLKSDLTGKINGHPMLINSKTVGEEHETTLNFEQIPASFFLPYMKSLPVELAPQGNISLKLVNHWKTQTHPDVHMDWIISLHQCKLSLKGQYATITNPTLNALLKKLYKEEFLLNQDIPFHISINEQELSYGFNLEHTNLKNKMSDIIITNLVQDKAPLKDVIKNNFGKAADLLKELF